MSEIKHIEAGRPARPGQLILERRKRLADQLIGNVTGYGKMLDIGCGNGAQTVLFAGCGSAVIGLDMTPHHETESPVTAEGITYICGSALELPFADSSFDTITCFEVLEHLPYERVALSEAYRVLRDGGRMLFSVPNKWWLLESHGATVPGLNWIPWNRIPFVGWLPTPIHSRIARARIYTMKRATTLAIEAGFAVRDRGYITAPLDVLPDSKLRDSLRNGVFKGDRTGNALLAVNLFLWLEKSNS